LFIIDAIDRGVIRKSDGIYRYEDKMLGGSMEAAVSLLKDMRYKALRQSIARETYPELLPKQEQEEINNNFIKDITGDVTPESSKGKNPSKK
jgi:hypothetical protein